MRKVALFAPSQFQSNVRGVDEGIFSIPKKAGRIRDAETEEEFLTRDEMKWCKCCPVVVGSFLSLSVPHNQKIVAIAIEKFLRIKVITLSIGGF